jgi:cytochrome c peroxidase
MVLCGMASVIAGIVLLAGVIEAAGATKIHTPLPITSLKAVPVPEPPATVLSKYIASKPAAIALGKALFWDMQVGSDNIQACASCHFAAGADNRSKNQLSPGLNRVTPDLNSPQPDITFQLGGANYQLQQSDYPFHKLFNVNDTNSTVTSDTNDVTSSQGVFRRDFPITPPTTDANCQRVADPEGFTVGGINTRRVEPRNAPTVINAVFNYRNFWDGRAQFYFNGVNPFGARDPNARVWATNPQGKLQQISVLIPFSSLASQAVGPPGSKFEMSCDGRAFREIGQKLVNPSVVPLGLQTVSPQDSVLGPLANTTGTAKGLNTTYKAMVQAAFQPQWWSDQTIVINGETYTQTQANFSLFFGLAVQVYEATLVADNSPFDQFIEGKNPTEFAAEQKAGLALFTDKAHCARCHGGAELTNASVRNVNNEHLERMIMGNDGVAVYDNGFYNIGVRPTREDLGVGGKDPFGNPLSETALCQQNFGLNDTNCNADMRNIAARPLENIPAAPLAPQCPAGTPSSVLVVDPITGTPSYTCDRIAVMGAFKAPSLRNVELTGPYFHNGGQATLRQVVDFYNRKGDFAQQNEDNLDPDIVQLGLSDAGPTCSVPVVLPCNEKDALVAFLLALTDSRVKYEQAPFDHPSLCVPNGHPGDQNAVTPTDPTATVKEATDDLACLAAIGSGGRATPLTPFMNLDPHLP